MMLRVILLMLAISCATQAVADDSPEARAARYYADGLEQPLLQLRTGAALIQACKGRLRGGCAKAQLRLATDNHVLALLDALTLFPQRLDADPAASTTKAKDLRQKIQDAGDGLMRTAGDYDLTLMARYGGTLLTCPPEDHLDSYHAALIALRLIDLVGFQGLSNNAVAAASHENTSQMGRESEQWRQRPAADCIAARKLGEYLMELMNSKLQPWNMPEPAGDTGREFDFSHPKKEAPKGRTPAEDRELAQSVAGNFIAVVATELQLQVFPESAPRIKELADQAGFPSQD